MLPNKKRQEIRTYDSELDSPTAADNPRVAGVSIALFLCGICTLQPVMRCYTLSEEFVK